MEDLTLYDKGGRAIAWISEDSYPSIFLYNGKPMAWISNENVYTYSGEFLGWFQNGWIWDRKGRAVFFTEESFGGPSRPSKKARPARGTRKSTPTRGARGSKPAKPTLKTSWSDLSGEQFFG